MTLKRTLFEGENEIDQLNKISTPNFNNIPYYINLKLIVINLYLLILQILNKNLIV